MSTTKELTNKDLARIFGLYLPCNVKYVHHTGGREQILKATGINIRDLYVLDDDGYPATVDIKRCRLSLKLPSEMSDEDAIEVVEMMNGKKPEEYSVSRQGTGVSIVYYDGNGNSSIELWDDGILKRNEITIEMPYQVADFLRSKAYLLPYQGIDLFNSGIVCISKLVKS